MIVALLLGLFCIGTAWSLVARQRQAVARLVETSDWLTTVRVARSAMRRDLRAAPGPIVVAADTTRMRVLRGWGLPCGAPGMPNPFGSGAPAVVVRYRGIRIPDSRKDSLRLLGPDGAFLVVAALEAARAPACDEEGEWVGYWLRTSAVPGSWGYLELFEPGGYHLQGHAVRYRSGAGYRQPLSPENLDRASRFDSVGERLRLWPWGGGREWVLGVGRTP